MALCLPVDSSLSECDCLFLIMFRQIAEKVLRKKIYKKDYFLMGRLRIERSPEISLPPCISKTTFGGIFVPYSGRTKYSALVSKLYKLSEVYLSPEKTQKAAVFFIRKILDRK